MTNPTEVNAFPPLSPEVLQLILRPVDPIVTSLVSRLWNEQTQAIVTSELRRVFHYLNPEKLFKPDVDLLDIKKVYKATLVRAPRDTATHFPRVSFERFLDARKSRDILAFWGRVPGGPTYYDRQKGVFMRRSEFDGLSSEDIRAQLKSWIEQTPDAQAITMLDLSRLFIEYIPPEIGKLTNLKDLILLNNWITALPPEIGKLTNLQHLYLDPNITGLPNAFSKSNVEIHLSSFHSLSVFSA
ncbi:MAG: leucine-rich repeat domain-containing protein [Simkaniaceae bacterium]|nr:leucine-rich repeat domain-containing protein [Simkaniaceae bacterium]